MKLYDFHAQWCGPCKVMQPIIDKFADNHTDIPVYKVNVDEEPDLCATYNVRNLPTLVLVDDDSNIITRHTGIIEYDKLEDKIMQCLNT